MHPNTESTHRAIIVIAEDSPTQATGLKHTLDSAGLRVFWAQNGVECLRLVEQVLPDLIILDLEMPQMNGLETCQRLKENPETCRIPVILFTRHDEPEFMRQGMESGVIDYIPKDAFANTVLLQTLREMGLID